MHKEPKQRWIRSKRPSAGAVFLVLVSLLCVAAVAANTPRELFQTRTRSTGRDIAQVETEPLVARARVALARMPPESRLDTIENVRLRRATQTTYRAVAELANERDVGSAPALYAKFLGVFSTFEEEAVRRGHANCAHNCKAYDEETCEKNCKTTNKKLCGCKLITFGCVVAECLF